MTIAIAAALCAVAVIVVLLRPARLVLSDADTGEVFLERTLPKDGTFSVTFVHSVNKTPVSDVYRARGRRIVLTGTVYYGFGAGVPTELRPGETLTMGEDGEMIVTGMDTEMTRLVYVVGTVSDHVLRIGDEEISLRDTCGRNSRVLFTLRRPGHARGGGIRYFP